MNIESIIPLFNQLSSVDEVCKWLPPVKKKVRRLLLLSDVHANWHALVAVLKHARGRFDSTWFLGDMLGYGPRPVECLQFLRRGLGRRDHWLSGNHEKGMVFDTIHPNSNGNGGKHKSWEIQRSLLKEHAPEDWKWLCQNVNGKHSRPIRRYYGGFCQVFVHNRPEDPYGQGANVYPDDFLNIRQILDPACKQLFPDDAACRASWIIHGHNHMPAVLRLRPHDGEIEPIKIIYGEPVPITRGAYWIDPGSVGQPRDGDTRAAYAILDTETAHITYYRVSYNVQAVQTELRRAEYPEDLVEKLGTGRIRDTLHFDAVYMHLNDGKGIVVRDYC